MADESSLRAVPDDTGSSPPPARWRREPRPPMGWPQAVFRSVVVGSYAATLICFAFSGMSTKDLGQALVWLAILGWLALLLG